MGWLAENVVLNHLKEHCEEFFYDSNGGELDFLMREGTRIIMRVQVWYADPVETTIPDRELKGFGQRGKTLEKAEKLILTNDLEQVQKVGGETACCLPLTLFRLDMH